MSTPTPSPVPIGGPALFTRAARTAVQPTGRTHRPTATLMTYLVCVALTACSATSGPSSPHTVVTTSPPSSSTDRPVAAGRPALTGADGVYAHAAAGMLNAVSRRARALVYVPNSLDNTVSVIDQSTFRVIRTFKVGALPQHVVPAWDLGKLWVNDTNANNLIPINPLNGAHGKPVSVADPYNLYFSPTGSQAIVMAERLHRIDFRDPSTMMFRRSLHVPCYGVNHADFTADLSTFVVSCEFSGKLLIIPSSGKKIRKVVTLNHIRSPRATNAMSAMRHGGPAAGLQPGATSMPQDVRLSPDGSTFVVADMLRNGVWLLNATTFAVRGFVHTGRGAHGIYPSRDGRSMYVSNRDEGTVSVLDASTLKVRSLWRIPGGGSPDMGGVSADGSRLWLSGRNDSVVYVLDTATGRIEHKIRVGRGPHGLCLWPQPGRFSLGHTGNMR
jgi:YVTN family beta-propeller protein